MCCITFEKDSSMGKEIFYITLLILFISCSTQKQSENVVDVEKTQVQVEQVESEVQETFNNSNIPDILHVAKDSTIIEETNIEKEVVVVYSEAIKEVEEERVESEEDDEIEVVYLTPDTNSVAIGLLTDSVSLSAEGDSVVVKTQKQTWWLVGFDFYEDSDPRSMCGYYNCTLDERRESHWGVWVNYQWLSVYASSHDKLVKIKVDKNTTGKTRYWRVVLETGDIFNSVYCQQPSM